MQAPGYSQGFGARRAGWVELMLKSLVAAEVLQADVCTASTRVQAKQCILTCWCTGRRPDRMPLPCLGMYTPCFYN